MIFSITTIIVLVATIAPPSVTPTEPVEIETTPIATPAVQYLWDGNSLNQIFTLTSTLVHKGTPTIIPTTTPTITPTITPTTTPRRRGSGRNGNIAISGNTPTINIDDQNNKIWYLEFNKGDPWNITLLNITTNALAYQFNDSIGEPDTTDNSWFVLLGHISPDEQYGIQICVFPGIYNVYTNASHNGITMEKNGVIIVNSSEACRSPPIPTPELNPIILVLTGLLGILLVSRKHRGNFL